MVTMLQNMTKDTAINHLLNWTCTH